MLGITLAILILPCLVYSVPGNHSYTHWTGVECSLNSTVPGEGVECYPWLEWWFLWLVGGLVLIILCTLVGCVCCGDYFSGCMTGIALCLPCISVPVFCYCCCSSCTGYNCELCGKGIPVFCYICCDVSHSHRKSCLSKHRADYDAIPPSSLYSCSNCQKPLKVWPSSRLYDSTCVYCNVMITNDDTNLHVCYPCAGRGPFNTNHLCNRHGLSQGGALTRVNWSDRPNFFQAEHASEEGNNQQESSKEENIDVNIEPPGYEEATKFPSVSTWDDIRKNKASQMIRQYSTGLKRMVSSTSSDAADDPEAERMVVYPRQPPTNPDIDR